MTPRTIRFVVRTPHEVVFEGDVLSLRVLTETGHVGVLPRMEALVLPVEAGLVLVRTGNQLAYVGSAGGLLSSDGLRATLYTPLGVVGADAAAIRAALDQALAEPGSGLAVRAKLGKLEGRILAELHAHSGEHQIPAGVRR